MSDPATDWDLIAVGLTTLDIAVRSVERLPGPDEGALVEAIRLSPAGTAAGTVAIAARLGLRCALASAVGQDPQGQVVRSMLEAEGVDTAMLATSDAMPTSTTVLPLARDGGRPTLHMIGASVMAPVPDTAFAALPRTRGAHFGGVGFPGPQSNGAAFLAAAREAGVFTSCDLIGPDAQTIHHLAALLPHVDLFMPSLAEVRVLTGSDDLDAAAAQFMAMGAGACLFKLGARGAALHTGDAVVTVPAFAITPVDTTSCGDALCAGYHAARLRGLAGREALAFASATAARVALGLGTCGALGGVGDVLAMLDEGVLS